MKDRLIVTGKRRPKKTIGQRIEKNLNVDVLSLDLIRVPEST